MEHASAPLMALGEARSDGKMGGGTNGKPSTKTSESTYAHMLVVVTLTGVGNRNPNYKNLQNNL